MFDVLGVTEEIRSAAVYPDMLTMRDGFNGEPVVEIPLGKDFETHFGRRYGVIFRPDLHNALIEAASSLPTVETVSGVKVEGFRQKITAYPCQPTLVF